MSQSVSGPDDFSESDWQELWNLKEEIDQTAADTGLSRRDIIKGAGLLGAGVLAGGVSAQQLVEQLSQKASADASTSDSDGNVGLPSDRVDLFADGIDSQLLRVSPSSTVSQDVARFDYDSGADIDKGVVISDTSDSNNEQLTLEGGTSGTCELIWQDAAQSTYKWGFRAGSGGTFSLDNNENLQTRIEIPQGEPTRFVAYPITLDPLSSAPSNPGSGDVACQDGTNWDPVGTGQEEIVAYLNGGWVALS